MAFIGEYLRWESVSRRSRWSSAPATDLARSLCMVGNLVVGIRTHGLMYCSALVGSCEGEGGRRRPSASPLPVSGPAAAPGSNGVAH